MTALRSCPWQSRQYFNIAGRILSLTVVVVGFSSPAYFCAVCDDKGRIMKCRNLSPSCLNPQRGTGELIIGDDLPTTQLYGKGLLNLGVPILTSYLYGFYNNKNLQQRLHGSSMVALMVSTVVNLQRTEMVYFHTEAVMWWWEVHL